MHTRYVVLFPLALSACAAMQSSYSEVSGDRYYNLAIADRRAVEIVSVGSTTGYANNRPVQISPGTYKVTVASRNHAGFRGGEQKSFELKIEPCKRYYINAQFANQITPDYEAVIDYVEDIAGCRPPTA